MTAYLHDKKGLYIEDVIGARHRNGSCKVCCIQNSGATIRFDLCWHDLSIDAAESFFPLRQWASIAFETARKVRWQMRYRPAKRERFVSKQYYGGQAVIEGVMMRGRKAMSIAVRNSQGTIVVHEEPLTAKIYTRKWGQWPFVRGLALLWDALGLGMRALMWSADVAMQEDDAEEQVEFSGPVAWTTIATSLAFAVAIFFLIPTLASRWFAGFFEHNPYLDAVAEGAIRLILFVVYLWAISLLPDIRRVFAYHGAEHKAINAYEDGAKLTVDNVQKYSVQHVRCGTSFLLYVLVISILLFAPLTFAWIEYPWLALLLRFVTRLLLVPLVAAISYEIIRFSANHAENPLMRLLIAPGLLLQRITTRPPDNSMVECAIAALLPVLAADGIEGVPPAQSKQTDENATGTPHAYGEAVAD